MTTMLGQVPLRMAPQIGRLNPRARMGAEELIELGQAGTTLPNVSSPGGGGAARTVTLTAQEGKLMVQVVENLVDFAQSYPIEFHSYCPTDRWQVPLTDVGTWIHEIDRQITAGATMVSVPAHIVFEMIDLEKCVSAARDARLSSAKWAFTLSAVGAFADMVLGITWLGIPAYIGGLALLLGRPLIAKFSAVPQEPYQKTLSGRGPASPYLSGHRDGRHCLGGECQLIAMKLKKEAETDSFKRQVLERVIVSNSPRQQSFHWGYVRPRPGGIQNAVYLKKDRFRVRVEGWVGDEVVTTPEWTRTTPEDCDGNIKIAVFEAGAERSTEWGPLNMDSHHGNSYWVEYIGPKSQGVVRRAGPFGCTGDPVDHAMEDSGFSRPGEDGGYVIFDQDGNIADDGTARKEVAA